MANLEQLYVGQGKVYMAARTAAGQTSGFYPVGDADTLAVNVAQTFLDHLESMSGNRSSVLHVPISTTWNMTVNIQNWSVENLAAAFYGASSGATIAGTVVAEAVTGYAGQMSPLAYTNVSAVTVTKGGTAQVLGTDYTLDAKNGTLTFIAAGAYTVGYAYEGNSGKVEAATQTIAEYVIRFEGINVANGGTPVIVTLHRVALDMSKTLPLLGTEVSTLTMDGVMLADSSVANGVSQYMTIVKR